MSQPTIVPGTSKSMAGKKTNGDGKRGREVMMAELLSDVSEYLYDDAPKNLEAKVPHVGMRLGLPKRMSVLTNWLTRLNLTGYDVADEGEIVHQTGGRKIVTAGRGHLNATQYAWKCSSACDENREEGCEWFLRIRRSKEAGGWVVTECHMLHKRCSSTTQSRAGFLEESLKMSVQ